MAGQACQAGQAGRQVSGTVPHHLYVRLYVAYMTCRQRHEKGRGGRQRQ